MRLELKQEKAINEHLRDNLKQLEAKKDEHLSELASELGSIQAINKRLESELDRARGEVVGGKTAITNLKFELGEKELAIANLTAENQKLEGSLAEAAKNEIFLSEELQRFKYGIVPGEEPHGEQLQLFPTPEEQAAVTPKTETENTESPAVKPEPSTVNPEPSRGTTKPKLLTAGELAKWINKTHHPEKPISDQNVRDWFNPKKNSDKNRTAVQDKYGFRLNHKDKRGTLHFTLL